MIIKTFFVSSLVNPPSEEYHFLPNFIFETKIKRFMKRIEKHILYTETIFYLLAFHFNQVFYKKMRKSQKDKDSIFLKKFRGCIVKSWPVGWRPSLSFQPHDYNFKSKKKEILKNLMSKKFHNRNIFYGLFEY
ncbi:hypothetical protein BpHYR1_009182 [Brachionus plicatilis]|uniref:Uncharacterized protein n=1 Tax=Brachionus plicatilis TaxID=10195 RepID=A0A3M7RN06_BRAPC|nr:hypothetical protein BpHYR1_009182 [Brachionus plicatilis]